VSQRPRSLVFLGTPAMSVPPLRALHEAGFDIRLVVTNPDTRRGRGSRTDPSPVKAAAVELGLPVSHVVDDVLDAGADLGVVVAFGRIIKPHVLAELPMVNLHFSLLPRWRGAAPVERAILAGDERTGVDLMVVEEGLDTGAVHARAELDIGPDETAEELRARLVDAGTALLVEHLQAGLGEPTPQEGEATYAHKLGPDDLRIDWDAPAAAIHRQVRVGGAWTTLDGERFKVWRTACPPTGAGIAHPTGSDPIELLEVQPAGRKRMDATAWANGARWSADDRLGS
jgi:methionyl-tRNA formyltransferase